MVWLLLAWALTIVFLPFPTSAGRGHRQRRLAKLLYIGTMAVSSALLAFLALAIGRHRDLRDTDARRPTPWPRPAPPWRSCWRW